MKQNDIKNTKTIATRCILKAPDKLRLNRDGELFIDNGNRCWSAPNDYLADWVNKHSLGDNEPVCVIRRVDLQGLYDELLFQREVYLCA